MYKYLVIVFVFFGTLGFAQTSEKYNSKYANFYRAEELFQKQQFGAARKEYRDFINSFEVDSTRNEYILKKYFLE